MEAIRQYIENMFITLPNSAEVLRAKDHLMEMAEDKYTSLIEEGCTDNEAVGKVIAEFGNLDDLKEELGIADEVDWEEQNNWDVRSLSLIEVKEMVSDYSNAALVRGIGIMCFICCVVPCILGDVFSIGYDTLSVAGMFVMIGIGVVLMIVQHAMTDRWDFVENTRCAVDMSVAEYIKDEHRSNRVKLVTMRSIGVLAIVLCCMPPILRNDEWGPAGLFISVGAGVLLLVYSGGIERIYNLILTINPNNTVGGMYSRGSGRVIFEDRNLAAIMSIYWPVISCIYLAISFVTFKWYITWVIYPVAGLIHKYIVEAFGVRE